MGRDELAGRSGLRGGPRVGPEALAPVVPAGQLVSPDEGADIGRLRPVRVEAPTVSGEPSFLEEETGPASMSSQGGLSPRFEANGPEWFGPKKAEPSQPCRGRRWAVAGDLSTHGRVGLGSECISVGSPCLSVTDHREGAGEVVSRSMVMRRLPHWEAIAYGLPRIEAGDPWAQSWSQEAQWNGLLVPSRSKPEMRVRRGPCPLRDDDRRSLDARTVFMTRTDWDTQLLSRIAAGTAVGSKERLTSPADRCVVLDAGADTAVVVKRPSLTLLAATFQYRCCRAGNDHVWSGFLDQKRLYLPVDLRMRSSPTHLSRSSP